jgi:serine/threonine-protein kinase PknK
VDDGDALGDDARAALRSARWRRARGSSGSATIWRPSGPRRERSTTFAVPPLDERAAAELVHRSVPSLPDALRAYLVGRVGGRPGALRAAVRRLAGRVVVSKEDVDAALGIGEPAVDGAGVGRTRTQTLEIGGACALETGRFDEAARDPGGARSRRGTEGERVRDRRSRRARVALGRGDTALRR